MNNFYLMEMMAKERRADLLREAGQARLMKLVREAEQPESRKNDAGIFSRLSEMAAGLFRRHEPVQASQPCP